MIFLVMMTLTSCGAPATLAPQVVTAVPLPAPSTPATLARAGIAPPMLSGEFVFAPGDGSIWTEDAATGKAQAIIKSSRDLFAAQPTISTGGQNIAYALSNFAQDGTLTSSIHAVDMNGQNDHVVVTPDSQRDVAWPAFSPDARWLYYVVTFKSESGGAKSEIDRAPSGGGSPQKIIDDAELAALSPDAKPLAFVRLNAARFTTSLWVADSDGQNPKQIVGDDVFAAVFAPRFSPDGASILFAASGPPRRRLSDKFGTRSECQPAILCTLTATAYADGLPWDLWLVTADGAHFQQLTSVGADSPWPAWSRDGKYVVFFETTGIYVLDRSQSLVIPLNRTGGHGVFDWWMPK